MGRRSQVRSSTSGKVRPARPAIRTPNTASTKLARAEEALRETDSRLARILEGIPHFVIVDRKGRYVEASARAARALGKSPDELLGHSVWELFPGADFRAQCKQAWKEQRPITFEHHVPAVDRWYEVFLFPSAKWLSIHWHDVTERMSAQEALRESELRLRTVLDNTPEVYAIYNADRRVAYLNATGIKLANTKLENILGRRDEELWPDEITRGYVPQVRRAYETGLSERFELDTTTASGDVFTRLMTVQPLKDSQGRVRQVLVTTSDLTERKRFERALVEADRHKNEFLASLSHELRNPLMPIRYSLYVLDRAPPGTEQGQRAKAIIERQVDHLTRIVDDLLDVTRISRGKIELQRTLFEIGTVVQRTGEDYAALFATEGISFAFDIIDERLVIDGDPTRIAQVVGNLLQNATKYTPKEGRVTLSLKAEARRFAIISVRDTGVGISAEMLPRLFRPFEQAPETRDRAKGGLGLGLSLVKALVEMHGGEVEAKSQGLGTGSEFVVRLPLHTGDADRQRRPARTGSASRRVLIIEDNIDAARGLADVLKMENHEVEVAHDGREGLRKAKSFKPNVVFCDIGMPGMDGHQVAKSLRSDKKLRPIYLVALTGYAFAADRAKGKAAGFDQYLAKPSTVAKVREILARVPASSKTVRRGAR
jgi:PAS domain S-box-containing protein